MSAIWYDAAVNAVTGNASASLNSGTLKIYSGAQPAINVTPTGLLATLTFGATAFGASSGGTATANAITSGTASATGTAQCFALAESGGAIVCTGTCGTSGSGADLILSSTAITSGVPVSCSSFTITG